jgi:hypothetical protein
MKKLLVLQSVVVILLSPCFAVATWPLAGRPFDCVSLLEHTPRAATFSAWLRQSPRGQTLSQTRLDLPVLVAGAGGLAGATKKAAIPTSTNRPWFVERSSADGTPCHSGSGWVYC